MVKISTSRYNGGFTEALFTTPTLSDETDSEALLLSFLNATKRLPKFHTASLSSCAAFTSLSAAAETAEEALEDRF
jgi:hypothetical protein